MADKVAGHANISCNQWKTVNRRRLTMVAPPSSPSHTTTPSTTMCDFLSAVHRRCIMHKWCSRAPARSELRDGVGVPPIAIKGGGVSTLVSVVIAQSLGGCV
jgi:hypothetical protein